MSRAEQLLAIEEIKRVKARYFRLLDTQRWDDFRALFVPDARIEMPMGSFEGAERFTRAVARTMQGTRTIHHGHMPEIALTGPDEAEGIWAMFDRVTWAPDAPPRFAAKLPGEYGFTGFGHYEERYRRDAGGWRIATMRLTRLHVHALVGEPPAERPGI